MILLYGNNSSYSAHVEESETQFYQNKDGHSNRGIFLYKEILRLAYENRILTILCHEPDYINRQTYMECQIIIRKLFIWIKRMYNSIGFKKIWFAYLHNRIYLINEAVITEIIGWDNSAGSAIGWA